MRRRSRRRRCRATRAVQVRRSGHRERLCDTIAPGPVTGDHYSRPRPLPPTTGTVRPSVRRAATITAAAVAVTAATRVALFPHGSADRGGGNHRIVGTRRPRSACTTTASASRVFGRFIIRRGFYRRRRSVWVKVARERFQCRRRHRHCRRTIAVRRVPALAVVSSLPSPGSFFPIDPNRNVLHGFARSISLFLITTNRNYDSLKFFTDPRVE